MQQFWERWKHHHLLQLPSAHHFSSSVSKKLEKGDVVLIASKVPRGFGDMGRIIQTYAGQDGHVRSCLVNHQDGKIMMTAVQYLYHLEVQRSFSLREDVVNFIFDMGSASCIESSESPSITDTF